MENSSNKRPLRKCYARDKTTNQYVKDADGKFFWAVYTVWPQFPDKCNTQIDFNHPCFKNPGGYYYDERAADWTGKAKQAAGPAPDDAEKVPELKFT